MNLATRGHLRLQSCQPIFDYRLAGVSQVAFALRGEFQ
jgi:hypothetical protein